MIKKILPGIFLSIIITLSASAPLAFSQESDEYLGEDRVLHNVAKELDPDGFGFDVLYTLEGVLEPEVKVNPEENSLTFYYDAQGIKEDVLIIELPKRLIDTPGLVFVDGVQDTNAIVNAQGQFATMYIPLFIEDREITIVGTKVIPEFGSIATVILTVSIISIIILTSTKKIPSLSLR